VEVDGDFANFRAVYDQLTDEVERARYQFIPDHLAGWYRTLDTTPRVAAVIRRLEGGVDYQTWRHDLTRSRGTRGLELPREPEKSLGIRLTMFRRFSESTVEEMPTFGHAFMSVGTSLNDNAQNVIRQLFMPMARELRRYLQTELGAVPASDRIVTLNHNSPEYNNVMIALDTLEEVLRGSNDYPDAEEKERVVAEVSAAKRLFQSVKVRVGAVVAVLSTPVLYLAKQFMGKAVGDAAQVVIDAVTSILGHIF
jgi:hypothetical protein